MTSDGGGERPADATTVLAQTSSDSGPRAYQPITREQSLKKAQETIRSVAVSRHDRPSLVAQIACEIGAEIIETIIPPGHDLNTVDLAKRYGASRTPVREALMVIENEGLVDIAPRRRPRAKHYSIAEVRDIYRTRAALLEFVAADVARFATAGEVALLRSILARMRQAAAVRDIKGYVWLNVEFNDNNSRIARNATVKRIIDSLLLRTIAMRRLSLSQPHRMEESLDDHNRLVDAYERGDSYMASAILRANHYEALSRVEKYHSEHGSLFAELTLAPENRTRKRPDRTERAAGSDLRPAPRNIQGRVSSANPWRTT